MIKYFSDRENGPSARTEEVITPVVWAAIVATVQGLIKSGAFGQRFLLVAQPSQLVQTAIWCRRSQNVPRSSCGVRNGRNYCAHVPKSFHVFRHVSVPQC